MMECFGKWQLSLNVFNLLWAIAFPVLFLLSSVEAEIRCYCNQPACVTTGYMCKSKVGSCFTEDGSGLYGCLEIRKKRCTSKLRCCFEDMCNYVDSMDIKIQVHTNNSPLTDSFSSHSGAELEAAIRRDVWFKASVIAVPIAGICILILLAMVAAKMLKQDTRRQKHLMELRRQHQLHHHLYRNVALVRSTEIHSMKDALLPWNKTKDTTIV